MAKESMKAREVKRAKLVASMLPKSVRREPQNHIRARVSSTLMKLSDVKLVRLVRNNKGVKRYD